MSEIMVVVGLMAVLNVALVIMHTGLAKKHERLQEMFSNVTAILTGAVAGDETMISVCKRVKLSKDQFTK